MGKPSKRLAVPKFKSENAEAQWWHDHRDEVDRILMARMEAGDLQRDMAQQLATKARASRNVTIRLAEADLALARKQAEEKGLPYQTYIKSVLHEALIKRERRRTS